MLNEVVARLIEEYFMIVTAIVTAYMIIYVSFDSKSKSLKEFTREKLKL